MYLRKVQLLQANRTKRGRTCLLPPRLWDGMTCAPTRCAGRMVGGSVALLLAGASEFD
jgi:hypothetical protein